MQTATKITAKDGMLRDYRYVIKIPEHIQERVKEWEQSGNSIDAMIADDMKTHWCAYVAVPKTHVMFEMEYHSFEDLSIGTPDVTELNYSGHLKFSNPEGYDKDNWYFGWDYNHSFNTEAPTESMVMQDINNCIDWIKETAHAFEEDKVWHYGCPRCRNND